MLLCLDGLWLRVDLERGCDWVGKVLIALFLDPFHSFLFRCTGSCAGIRAKVGIGDLDIEL
jgi:hypothetical protein